MFTYIYTAIIWYLPTDLHLYFSFSLSHINEYGTLSPKHRQVPVDSGAQVRPGDGPGETPGRRPASAGGPAGGRVAGWCFPTMVVSQVERILFMNNMLNWENDFLMTLVVQREWSHQLQIFVLKCSFRNPWRWSISSIFRGRRHRLKRSGSLVKSHCQERSWHHEAMKKLRESREDATDPGHVACLA